MDTLFKSLCVINVGSPYGLPWSPNIFHIYMIRCGWLGDKPIEMTTDREEWPQLQLPMNATAATRTGSGTPVIRKSSVPPCAWVGPTERNQTQWRSHRLQHHYDSWLLNATTSDGGHSNNPQTGKRLADPQPARQPLMSVNSKKSGHLGLGCGKYWTQKSCVSHHKF